MVNFSTESRIVPLKDAPSSVRVVRYPERLWGLQVPFKTPNELNTDEGPNRQAAKDAQLK
jgi:hypothetical protein